MGSINTETETVIKKILPYMKRRGYNIEQDFDFETAVSTTDRYTKGYVDILVDRIQYKNDITKKQMEDIRKCAKEYVNNRI